MRVLVVVALVLSLWDGVRAAENANKVKPGEFIIDHPTLINLGFEWLIDGDENRNAQVDVSYRKEGATAWHAALPRCVCMANAAVEHFSGL